MQGQATLNCAHPEQMPPFSILTSEARTARAWVRRNRGRRATDRRLTLETLLSMTGVVAWAWCAYQLLRLFLD